MNCSNILLSMKLSLSSSRALSLSSSQTCASGDAISRFNTPFNNFSRPLLAFLRSNFELQCVNYSIIVDQ